MEGRHSIDAGLFADAWPWRGPPWRWMDEAVNLRKVITGGQSGVDRAALDAALDQGLACGGWCPAGRWAEDGAIPGRYPLAETPDTAPEVRTRRNVEDADGTLVVISGSWDEGSRATESTARALGRPVCVIDMAAMTTGQALATISAWIETEGIDVLNIAGPRESNAPGIHRRAHGLFTMLFVGLE